MNELRDLLELGAGPAQAGFGVAQVWERSRKLRRQRLVAFVAAAALLVAVSFWFGGQELELFTSDAPDPAGPRPGEAAGLVVYASEGDIWVVAGADEDRPVNVTNTAEREANPTISPDGRTIVFERIQGPDSATTWGLHRMPVDGGNSVQLTSGEREVGYDRSPAWSPDGQHIVFVRHIARGTEIVGTDTALVVMRSDGSVQQEITERPGSVGDPVWSPDGESIFFGTVRGEAPWVARLKVGTGEQEFVVQGSSPQPLDPDGIAFLRTVRPFVTDVFAVSLSGGRLQRLSRGHDVQDLVAFGEGGLAVAEGGADPTAGGDPGAASRIIPIRAGDEWRPSSIGPIYDLEGFSIFVGR